MFVGHSATLVYVLHDSVPLPGRKLISASNNRCPTTAAIPRNIRNSSPSTHETSRTTSNR
jgi:hypothetical protein